MRITDAIDATIWALDSEWLELIRGISLGEGEGPEAVAARLGRPLQNAQTVRTRDGVAVIPITGPIFRYANLFTEVSGASSIEIFARDLRTALDDPNVHAIVLEINSPGGQVDGINEAANMIRAGTAEKPIVAYVSGMGASAGYWLASAAGELVIDDTAQVGSIGVVTTVMRKKSPRSGEPDSVEIVSSQSPNKRPDIDTDAGRAELQARIDAIASVFIDAVAEFRGVDAATVVEEFGAGGVKVGRAAVAARMADRNGSLEMIVSELATGEWDDRRSRMDKPKTYTQAELDEQVAKALEQGKAESRTEGEKSLAEATKAERERILGIDAHLIPGHEKLAADCKADGSSVADFALKQTAAEKSVRATQLAAIKKDGTTIAPPAAPSVSGDPAPVATNPNAPIEERAKAKWDANAELREQFSNNFAWYLASEKAEESGKVRTIGKRVA